MERGKHHSFIPKNGQINKSVHYRPVSLTLVIGKLLETIIMDPMMDFLMKHKLVNPSCFGFIEARSCLTNVLCLFKEITKWVVYIFVDAVLLLCMSAAQSRARIVVMT